jgi:hypothetical protein
VETTNSHSDMGCDIVFGYIGVEHRVLMALPPAMVLSTEIHTIPTGVNQSSRWQHIGFGLRVLMVRAPGVRSPAEIWSA